MNRILKFVGFRPKQKGTTMQSVFTWFNPPDPNSTEWKNVLDWYAKQGAPSPTLFYLPLGTTARDRPPDPPYLMFPGIAAPGVDACILMNQPASTLRLLKSLGGWPIQHDIPEYEPPAPPAVLPPPPPPAPDNPVGSLMNEIIVEPDGSVVPEKRRVAPGALVHGGEVYPVPVAAGQPQFSLVVRPTPWDPPGHPTQYWARIDNVPAGAPVHW